MAKPEWGIKRICPSCETKFYDFRRSPIVCPSCGATIDPEALTKSKRSRRSEPLAKEKASVVKAAKKSPAVDDDDDDSDDFDDAGLGGDLDDDDDDDEDLIEDASDLGEDDEDVSNVIDPAEERE